MIKQMKIINAYFTTTKKQAVSNEINSEVKTINENWYTTNMSSLASKISTNAGYCNDRMTTQTKDGGIGFTSTIYDSTYRLSTLMKPSFKCTNESNDLFTSSSNSYGNKKLSAPVGLITADELAYAGNLYSNWNFQVYSHSGYWFWTLSPSTFSGGMANINRMASTGNFKEHASHNYFGVRPVISLNSSSIVDSGTGSLTDPYVIGN